MAPSKSLGCPHRPAGIRSMICLLRSESAMSASFMSVAMYPGAIALTFTPFPAHPFENDLTWCQWKEWSASVLLEDLQFPAHHAWPQRRRRR